MDARILFPEISLFRSNKVCSSNLKSRDPAPKISKARRRKNRLMKLKNTMVSSSIHIKQPDGDDLAIGVQPWSTSTCSVEPPPPRNFDEDTDGLAQPKVDPLKIRKKLIASSSSQGVDYDLRPRRK